MLKYIFIFIICIIIIIQLLEACNDKEDYNNVKINESKELVINENTIELLEPIKTETFKNNEIKVTEPWSRIEYHEDESFPYYFFIKVKIPSLNDYQAWKDIIPNLNFDPKTGELIIPSKDESSALALVNLIISNFIGNLSLKEIIEKNLINISINKCQSHQFIQDKIRQQIIEAQSVPKIIKNNYEEDLSKINNKNENENEIFSDIMPFNHNVTNITNKIEAYASSDFSYL
jgi:hypothetical protein